MNEKVMSFVREHDVKLNDCTVIVGVSGGPDSVALLHVLYTYRESLNLRLIALSINHQLRGHESKADIHYVENICRQWNIECLTVNIDVNKYKEEHRCGTQVAARALRYKVFSEKMASYRADYLMLGHHGDDQIETLVMSLMRSADSTSFIGIPFRRKFSNGSIVRPLLCVTKKEIENYCEQHKIKPRIDASNEDMTYTRNYVRKQIVPKLTATNERLHTTVQHLNESLIEDETYLMQEAKQAFNNAVSFYDKEKRAILNIKKISELPLSLQRRVYRITLDYLYEELPNSLSYIHERSFLTLIKKEQGNKKIDFPQRLVLERAYDQLLFYFKQNSGNIEPFQSIIHKVPMKLQLPNCATLSVSYTNHPDDTDALTYVYPANQLEFPLTIRSRLPGDRMTYDGLQGSKKIKDILIDEKIPRHERDEVYLLVDHKGRIFWLIGLRKDHQLKTRGTNSEHYVRITYRLNTKKGEG